MKDSWGGRRKNEGGVWGKSMGFVGIYFGLRVAVAYRRILEESRSFVEEGRDESIDRLKNGKGAQGGRGCDYSPSTTQHKDKDINN